MHITHQYRQGKWVAPLELGKQAFNYTAQDINWLENKTANTAN